MEEPPHILFTPYLKSLAAELTEDADHPLEKARRFYDFITKNMTYTYMPSYFTQENLAETCARTLPGDCGNLRPAVCDSLPLCRDPFRLGKADLRRSRISAAPMTGPGSIFRNTDGSMRILPTARPQCGIRIRNAGSFILEIWTPSAWRPTGDFRSPLIPPSGTGAVIPMDNQLGGD